MLDNLDGDASRERVIMMRVRNAQGELVQHNVVLDYQGLRSSVGPLSNVSSLASAVAKEVRAALLGRESTSH
jgi:hypothetical protein